MLLRRLYQACDRLRHRARLRTWREELARGRRAEDLAHRRLQEEGLVVVDRNWTAPEMRGEVDLVAWEGDTLVFVEVKSRAHARFGDPARAVGRDKRRQVIRAARHFLRRWRLPEERVRFDLVTVVFEPFEIRHLRDAWSFADWDRVS